MQNEGTIRIINTGGFNESTKLVYYAASGEIRNYGTIYVSTGSPTGAYLDNSYVTLYNTNGTIKTDSTSTSSLKSSWYQDAIATISGTSYFDQGVRFVGVTTASGAISARSGAVSSTPTIYLGTKSNGSTAQGGFTANSDATIDRLTLVAGNLTLGDAATDAYSISYLTLTTEPLS